MKQWDKQKIVIAGGAKVFAQMLLIVSASRSTDVPAFYFDWFIDFNTCPHLCHYCYVNTNNTAALENWKQHCQCPHAETIMGLREMVDDYYTFSNRIERSTDEKHSS